DRAAGPARARSMPRTMPTTVCSRSSRTGSASGEPGAAVLRSGSAASSLRPRGPARGVGGEVLGGAQPGEDSSFEVPAEGGRGRRRGPVDAVVDGARERGMAERARVVTGALGLCAALGAPVLHVDGTGPRGVRTEQPRELAGEGPLDLDAIARGERRPLSEAEDRCRRCVGPAVVVELPEGPDMADGRAGQPLLAPERRVEDGDGL